MKTTLSNSSATSNPFAMPPPSPTYLAPLREADWVVYAKPPFGGPQQALEYLGRYTHRVAISNHQAGLRLKTAKSLFSGRITGTKVRTRVMTLDDAEFIRRFLIHSCRPVSSVSVTSAFLPTAIAKPSWRSAANC